MRYIAIIFIIVLAPVLLFGSKLDDLDKEPIGAHQNQMFLGAFVNIGGTLGELITAEYDFLKDNIYYLAQSGIYKKLYLSHLTFTAGISYEWMPIDHLGLKFKTRYTSIIQRTLFGAGHQNWSETLYQDVSFYLGVVGHLTNRKNWDVTLAPTFGYAVAWLTPTVIASVPDIASQLDTYTSSVSTIMVNNFTMGAELAFTLYFKGGLYLSIGFEWIMNILIFESTPYVEQTGTSNVYFAGKTESFNHTLSAYISVGYAFDN